MNESVAIGVFIVFFVIMIERFISLFRLVRRERQAEQWEGMAGDGI